MRPLTRTKPAGPVEAYKTYEIDTPAETHWRPARCSEVDCPTQAKGWVTVVDETTDLGQRQAHYIRRGSGRAFREERAVGGTAFRFPPGEECFAQHQVRVERPEIYLVRGGDWRGQVGGVRQHDRPEHWVEDFAEHQDQVRARLERG